MKPLGKNYLSTIAAVWIACLVLFTLGYLLVLAPQQKKRQQIRKELEEKKQTYELALKVTDEKTRNQLNARLRQLQNRLARFVVAAEDAANVVFDISQLAGQNNVESFSIKSANKNKVLELPNCKHLCEDIMAISFVGTWDQFATFLNDLERHRPTIFVDQFAITRSKGVDSKHEVEMNVSIFVEKQKEES